MKKKARLLYSDVFAAVLCGVMVILPWISHLKLWRISDRAAGIYANVDGVCPDLFLYDREALVIAAGILMLLFLVGEHIFPDHVRTNMPLMNRCNRWIIICVLIYISGAAASALFSADRYTTAMGAVTEGEGVFAVISYMLLFLAAMNYFGGKHTWKFLYAALMFLMIITIVLSCIEFFYRPLFEIPFFKNMLAGAEYQPYLDSIQNESYRNFVTLTFYNPNYFGGFCLLLIPQTSHLNKCLCTLKIQ